MERLLRVYFWSKPNLIGVRLLGEEYEKPLSEMIEFFSAAGKGPTPVVPISGCFQGFLFSSQILGVCVRVRSCAPAPIYVNIRLYLPGHRVSPYST
jgi:hypothetical protein